ncbi:chemotaxis protein CheB [Larkinella arboricola]|uniref:protein-glutamate methylesterase n=1 Tax=Larkinella arboricola TaxID=643671 RepID=A0A327XAP1_LARAB|nr:chemotaxis protein CheB [Larkinella arboricola]RAK02692.1 two-component system chemotaxis response regulator CheB [Larkinella arboricola]
MSRVSVVVIGGSAGSIPVVTELLQALPRHFQFSVIIVLHRLRNVISSLDTILGNKVQVITIREPNDKEEIREQYVYLAPQNYHLLIEADKTFSLDYSETVHHSRPSIDVTFESVAQVYASQAVAVLLSGANQDGADGLQAIINQGGMVIVQDPATAEYPAMPKAALERNREAVVLTPPEIAAFLRTLTQ